jgi:ClpP class serine protease
MSSSSNIPVIGQVLNEQNQSHETRKKLITQLEGEIGRTVITLFTSFRFPVVLSDDDADMLEAILQKLNLSKGIALLLSSPGGSGLAAERIINICRKYSGTNDYWVIVPGKAKSAATMVGFGASKIFMGPASELGPIDPQLTIIEDGRPKRFSLCNVVDSYNQLFADATKVKGNLQPYLQQLARYDSREIKEYEDAISLSGDIAVKALKTGMMSSLSDAEIKKKIAVFLTPKETKAHGRLIDRDKATSCGLAVDRVNIDSKTWKLSYELFVRLNHFVSNQVAKCIESSQHSYVTTAGRTE